MRAGWCEMRFNHRERHFFQASRKLALAFLLTIFSCITCQAQISESRLPSPPRLATIYVQVSLPNGRPAGGAIVTLTPNSGVPRKGFTSDSGRLEFPGMPEGQYKLTATSTSNENLTSDIVEANPGRMAQGNLTVQLLLRDRSDYKRDTKRGVIRVGENEQKIPKEAHKAFQQGVKLKQEGERDKALVRFSKAIELFPEYFQAFSERGDLYVIQRKLTEAATDFAEALRIDPQYGPALRGSGYCKLEKKEFARAIDDFERSISAEPENANTYLLLGIAYLELDRREPARRALQKALSFSTQYVPRAHIHLANLYALEHQYQQAADEIRLYLDAEPAAPDAKEMREMETKWRARAAR